MGKTENCTCTYTTVWRCFDLTMYLYHTTSWIPSIPYFDFHSSMIFHPTHYQAGTSYFAVADLDGRLSTGIPIVSCVVPVAR